MLKIEPFFELNAVALAPKKPYWPRPFSTKMLSNVQVLFARLERETAAL